MTAEQLQAIIAAGLRCEHIEVTGMVAIGRP
jgi:acid stress-induced BolA-like protein IbaG/YrbA